MVRNIKSPATRRDAFRIDIRDLDQGASGAKRLGDFGTDTLRRASDQDNAPVEAAIHGTLILLPARIRTWPTGP